MITVEDARRILPEKTKDLIDAQVRFMLSRIGDINPDELSSAWDEEYELHINEMANFLYDMYLDSKMNKGLAEKNITNS